MITLVKFIQKLFGSQKTEVTEETPDWARFMDVAAFTRFKVVLEREVRKRHRFAEFDWAGGSWVNKRGSQSVRGIVNIAQICNNLNPDDWQAEVVKFVEFTPAALPSEDLSFEDARKDLKVRLYPRDMGAGSLVTAAYCDSFFSVLALDGPGFVKSVSEDEAARWDVPLHELFRIGIENVLQQDPPEVQKNWGDHLLCLEGESFFTATHALMLDRYFDFDEEKGLLVMIPNRHFVGCLIVSPAIAPYIPGFVNLANQEYEAGPGSITPDVLWFRKGQFERVSFGNDGVVGPDALVGLL